MFLFNVTSNLHASNTQHRDPARPHARHVHVYTIWRRVIWLVSCFVLCSVRNRYLEDAGLDVQLISFTKCCFDLPCHPYLSAELRSRTSQTAGWKYRGVARISNWEPRRWTEGFEMLCFIRLLRVSRTHAWSRDDNLYSPYNDRKTEYLNRIT